MNAKINSKKIAGIILVSILLSFSYNYFSSTGIPLIAKEKTLEWADDSLLFSDESFAVKDSLSSDRIETRKMETEQQEKSDPEIKEIKISNDNQAEEQVEKKEKKELTEPAAINLKQAYNLYQQNILFIDAREPADYNYAHIKGAVNIPFDHLDDYEHLLENIDKNQKLVTYCAGTDCDLSILLGNLLFEKGFRNIYIFFGGWNEWSEAGYPVEEGEPE